jgi:hypothetical protein
MGAQRQGCKDYQLLGLGQFKKLQAGALMPLDGALPHPTSRPVFENRPLEPFALSFLRIQPALCLNTMLFPTGHATL